MDVEKNLTTLVHPHGRNHAGCEADDARDGEPHIVLLIDDTRQKVVVLDEFRDDGSPGTNPSSSSGFVGEDCLVLYSESFPFRSVPESIDTQASLFTYENTLHMFHASLQ